MSHLRRICQLFVQKQGNKAQNIRYLSQSVILQDKRPDKIDVDEEKEERYNLGPKSQAEVTGFGGFVRNDTSKKKLTAEELGSDKANIYSYADEGLNLSESYGRDMEVEEPSKGESEKFIENVNLYKKTIADDFNKREFRASGMGYDAKKRGREEYGVGASTFDTLNNAFPVHLTRSEELETDLSYIECKQAFESGLREGKGEKKEIQRDVETKTRNISKFASDI